MCVCDSAWCGVCVHVCVIVHGAVCVCEEGGGRGRGGGKTQPLSNTKVTHDHIDTI